MGRSIITLYMGQRATGESSTSSMVSCVTYSQVMLPTRIFPGTRVSVFGTIESIQRAPLWLCTIDTTLTGNSPPLEDYLIANQFLLCDFPDLAVGSHTLIITPFFNTTNSKFWLDYVAYVPSSLPEDIPASSVIKVQDNDEDVKYSGTWVGFGFPDGSADVTQTFDAGSFCTYTFNGEYTFRIAKSNKLKPSLLKEHLSHFTASSIPLFLL
jgi:hypothetical protein